MKGELSGKCGFVCAAAAIVAIALAVMLASCSSGNSPDVSQAASGQVPSGQMVSDSQAKQDVESEQPKEDVARHALNENTAIEFMHAFYDDWDFKDGNAIYSTEVFNHRCLPYIAESGALHDELSKDDSFGIGSESRFVRSAALHAAEVKPSMRAIDVCVVDVSYCGTQNNVTQDWYDDMMKRLNIATWTLVFDENGKVSSMEEGDVADKYTHDGLQGDADVNTPADDESYSGVNGAVSRYVEMAANIDWQSGSAGGWDRWKAFDASSETPERLATLAFAYLFRHNHESVESCSVTASAIGANATERIEYNARVKLGTLEDAVEHLYGVQTDLTTVSAAGQWDDPHYHDGYMYFYITNGVGLLAGAALADSIEAKGDGTYQVNCGLYSNSTGNMFDPDDDSVYAGTPNELMQRYGDVERVANATAIVELEKDGRWTLKKFFND